MIPFTTLLTQPKHAWGDLSASVDRHPRAFVPLWLALPLIPAICLFIGTTQVGWRLPGNDQTQYLSASSGSLLALWCYLGFLCGVVIMAYLVRWVLFRTESRPDIGRSMAFTTTIAVPLMLAGVAALVLLLVGGALYTVGAVFYATRWPNPWPRVFGYHEFFHAATVVAAICHYIAIWLAMYS